MGTGKAGDEEGQGDENKQGWENEGTELVNTLRGRPKCGTASGRGHPCPGWEHGGWVQGLSQGGQLGNIQVRWCAQEGTPSKHGLGGVPRGWG